MSPFSQPSPWQLRAMADIAGAGPGHVVRVHIDDADSCCDMGWLKGGKGHYVLTDDGRRLLKAQEAVAH